jgi:transposase
MFIGIDPHPGQHTAAAVEPSGAVVETRTFPNMDAGWEAFLEWLSAWPAPRVAVEGPTQPFFAHWSARLLAEGYAVVPVPTQQVVARRRRASRGKTDSHDALLIAQVLLAKPQLAPLDQPAWVRPLQELTRTRRVLADSLKGHQMRLKSLQDLLVRHALEEVVRTLQAQVTTLGKEIERRVKELAPTLLSLSGVGAIVAATVLSQVGNVAHFSTQHHFTAYCGTSPQPWQSGASHRVRVNTSGNRRLNWALHIVARTRLRIDPLTQAFVARKELEGKTHREALRILKTYIARQLYQLLASIAPQLMGHHISTY